MRRHKKKYRFCAICKKRQARWAIQYNQTKWFKGSLQTLQRKVQIRAKPHVCTECACVVGDNNVEFLTDYATTFSRLYEVALYANVEKKFNARFPMLAYHSQAYRPKNNDTINALERIRTANKPE